ncbi:MAG: hypothetical protein IJJ33_02710 [Victivallales bacterium]|nr:hypothetical protein [Victivallales bacterium]
MSELHYQLEFFSPWHCGSGMGGGEDADYRPLLDEGGLPFVPGKTIKGLLREAAEATGWDAAMVAQVFGTPSRRLDGESGDSTEGHAHFSNAELPMETRQTLREAPQLQQELLIGRYFSKLDDHGQTEDGALRRGEYAVPMKLYGCVDGLSEEERAALAHCLGYVKQLGVQRSRGFGRCRLNERKGGCAQTRQQPAAVASRPADGVFHFRCHFLSPVVLNRSAATQGQLGVLEYIPGANWLGIAARNYQEYGEEAFAVFHSGAVQFGFGYPMDGQKRGTLPCPANWHVAKNASLKGGTVIYGTPEAREKVQKEKQPKQVRGGFFVPGEAASLWRGKPVSFSLKSAYDSERRRSEDAQMYGYTALPAGSDWHFAVRVSASVSDAAVGRLVSSLVGRHQIGRSRTAQYGAVEIELLERSPLPKVERMSENHGVYLLYAASPWAFLDGNGEFATTPTVSELGFAADARIDERHSHIRIGAYAPWNGVRKSRDAMRQVILPGSVLAVRSETPPDEARLAKGVGLYLSEGLGQALVNPVFLEAERLEESKVRESSRADGLPTDQGLLDYLKLRCRESEMERRIYQKVGALVTSRPEYRKISASQWGAIRAAVVALGNYDGVMDYLFKEDEGFKSRQSEIDYVDIIKNNRVSRPNNPGFLRHGKAAQRWKKLQVKGKPLVEDFKSVLEEAQREFRSERHALAFLEVLTAKLAKETIKKELR